MPAKLDVLVFLRGAAADLRRIAAEAERQIGSELNHMADELDEEAAALAVALRRQGLLPPRQG